MDYAQTLLGFLPGGSRRTPGLKELLSAASAYLPEDQVERIRAAAEFGADAHRGQKRKTGEPYIAHPVAAAEILAGLRVDPDTIVAAILHDVIEDTPIAKTEIAARFGESVAEIVDGVTKLDQIKFKSREEAQAESFRKMLLAMVRDLRVILVKLADRTHNKRTIEGMPAPRRRAIARETLDIYAPLAERLGLYNLKLELEDLGFRALYPQRYRVLERAMKRARGNQKEFLPKIAGQTPPSLLASRGSPVRNSHQRDKYTRSLPSTLRPLGWYARTMSANCILARVPSAVSSTSKCLAFSARKAAICWPISRKRCSKTRSRSTPTRLAARCAGVSVPSRNSTARTSRRDASSCAFTAPTSCVDNSSARS